LPRFLAARILRIHLSDSQAASRSSTWSASDAATATDSPTREPSPRPGDGSARRRQAVPEEISETAAEK
jgi:hypothetical protein